MGSSRLGYIMAVTSLGIPGSHATAEPLLGRSYDFFGSAVLQAAAERFDVRNLLDFWGDLAGSGTDTMAQRRVSGMGWGASFTTLASETEAIAPSAISAAMDTTAIGQHGLSLEETFKRAILSGDGMTLEAAAAMLVDSVQAKLRSLTAYHIGANFGSNTADAAAQADVDDVVATRAAFEDYAGFDPAVARVVGMLDPTQIKHVRASMRSETALKFPERFDADQSLQRNAGFRFTFMDMDFYASGDVTYGSSTWYGGFWQLGALGWVKASPSQVGNIADVNPTFVDELGLLISRETSGTVSTKKLIAHLFAGVGQVSTDVLPAFQFRSHI